MKKTTFKTLMIALMGLLMSTFAAANLTKSDLGEYAVVEPNTGETTDLHLRFTAQGNAWRADVLQGNTWKKFACENGQNYCLFKNSSKKTINRLFAAQPELLNVVNNSKDVKLACTDSKSAAFCRLDDAEKTVYLFLVFEGNTSKLIVLHKLQ